MNSFFVPVDFSSNAQTALRYAAHLAQAFGGIGIHAHFQMGAGDFQHEEKRAAAQKRLSDFVIYSLSKMEGGDKVPVTATLSTGNRLTELIKTDAFQEADLVVMGTKGASGVLQQLRGSNTYHIVKDSNKPVLVVPGRAAFTPFRHILYCSDFDRLDSFKGLELVKHLAMRFNAEVRITHVKVSSGKSSNGRSFESFRQADFFNPEVKHSFKIIRHKSIISGIQYYIDLKRDNQLIVMVKREHGMLEELFMTNNTREMVFHTQLPLLVINEE